MKVLNAVEGQLEGKLELILAVWKPSWSSEGHLGVQIGLHSATSADCTGPSGVQEARVGSTDGCTEPKLAVRAQLGGQVELGDPRESNGAAQFGEY